jgi:preprotein translocase subunit SecE
VKALTESAEADQECRPLGLCPAGAQGEDRSDVNPFKFFQEVRQETAKVTWPTRNETWVTTVAVLIMVTLASIFFLLADQLMGWIVSTILTMAR